VSDLERRRRNKWNITPPWGEPLYYRAIASKIGEELRKRFKLPQDMPDKLRKLLTRVTQIDHEDKA
jgi:hypothetical protein